MKTKTRSPILFSLTFLLILTVAEQNLRGELLGWQEPVKRVIVHAIRPDEVDKRRPDLVISLHQV